MFKSRYKYLLAYLTPLTAFFGLYLGGYWSPGAFYLGFILIPFLELFVKASESNPTDSEEEELRNNKFYDIILYLNLPIFYALIAYLIYILQVRELSTLEYIAAILNVGIVGGTLGINVAHELGHKESRFAQFIAKCMLLPTLYMHFIIEHNRGHHKYVATLEDPATARKGESIYAFFFRSTLMSYLHAWKLESIRLHKEGNYSFSFKNEMIRFTLIQAIYLIGVYYFFGLLSLMILISIAVFSFLLLESVNYIEHYGLLRKKNSEGIYERADVQHSWNSNHELGRIFLYELSRHSDHHLLSTKPYQILKHHYESPQLPVGYPMSILIALLPPAWFKIMNKRLISNPNL